LAGFLGIGQLGGEEGIEIVVGFAIAFRFHEMAQAGIEMWGKFGLEGFEGG
jgi:hypothetical protein